MNISPLPITDYAQTHFITHLSLSVHWTTIRSYLSALHFFQIRAGLPDPSLNPSPKIPYLLKGIHKLTPDHKRTTRHPITPDIMQTIHTLWSQQPTTFILPCFLWIYEIRRAYRINSRQPSQPSSQRRHRRLPCKPSTTDYIFVTVKRINLAQATTSTLAALLALLQPC